MQTKSRNSSTPLEVLIHHLYKHQNKSKNFMNKVRDSPKTIRAHVLPFTISLAIINLFSTRQELNGSGQSEPDVDKPVTTARWLLWLLVHAQYTNQS